MNRVFALILLGGLIPLLALGWGGPISAPQLGFPQGTPPRTIEKTLKFLMEDVTFLEGSFLNEYSWQKYGGTPAKVAELLHLLHAPGEFEVQVSFADLKDNRVAFQLNQTSKKQAEVTIVINTTNPDFKISELTIRIPPCHGTVEELLSPVKDPAK